MKKLLVVLALASTSVFTQAESEFKVDLNNIDTNKFCVYDKAVYSIGSIVVMGDVQRECKYFSHTINGVEPGARWAKI